eukprot:381436_1
MSCDEFGDTKESSKMEDEALCSDDAGWDDSFDDDGDMGWGHNASHPQSNAADPSEAYTILGPEKLLERHNKVVSDISEVLGLPPAEAVILLRSYRWKQSKLIDNFTENSKKIRKKHGLDPQQRVRRQSRGAIECPQCYDDVRATESFSLQCNHQSCRNCWTDYIEERIRHGSDCVLTPCNFYQCNVIVPDDVIIQFVSDPKLRDLHRLFVLRSFVAGCKHLVWCPAPDCQFACEYSQGGMMEVVCGCGFVFCFKCHEASHRPAPCDWAKKWRIKSSSEAENATWILANTKMCPECDVQIEKNQGCNHMSCRSCKHEFCWLCKGAWKTHGSATADIISATGTRRARPRESLLTRSVERTRRRMSFSGTSTISSASTITKNR